MKSNPELRDAHRMARMEALLRAASAELADYRCPEDLVERALSSNRVHESRSGRLYIRALAGAGAAIAFLVPMVVRHWLPSVSTGTVVGAHAARSGIKLARNSLIGMPKPVKTGKRKADRNRVVFKPVRRAVRHPNQHRMVFASALPRAIWKDETVRTFATSVVAAGWVVQPDPENEQVHLRTALLEVPIESGRVVADTRIKTAPGRPEEESQ